MPTHSSAAGPLLLSFPRGLRPGSALPDEAYSQSVLYGRDEPPTISVANQGSSQYYVVIAYDQDESPLEASPLWAKAVPAVVGKGLNVVSTAGDLSNPRYGHDVISYHGPAPTDEFLHRVFFRVYALNHELAPFQVQSWAKLQDELAKLKLGIPGAAGSDGQYQEVMLTAVFHRQKNKMALRLHGQTPWPEAAVPPYSSGWQAAGKPSGRSFFDFFTSKKSGRSCLHQGKAGRSVHGHARRPMAP